MNATVFPSPQYARTADSPSPVLLLTVMMGTSSDTADNVVRTSSTYCASTASDLVRTITGCAPLSNASTSSRSRRRSFGGAVTACNRNTVSMFDATICRSARAPSKLLRRVSALRRSNTSSTRSSFASTRMRSPTATSMPMLRTRTERPSSSRTVLQPLSSLVTRPTSASVRSSFGVTCASICRNRTAAPRLHRAVSVALCAVPVTKDPPCSVASPRSLSVTVD